MDDLEEPEDEAPKKKGGKKGYDECPDCETVLYLIKCGTKEDGSMLNCGRHERVCLGCALERIFRGAEKRAARRAA